MLGTAFIAAPASGETADDPKAVALLFYADWCGSCEVLDPKLDEAKAAVADEPVLFVTLDHTDEATSRQAAMLVNAMGLREVYAPHAGRTGFVLLVDRKTNETITRITRDSSEDEIEATLRSAVAKRSE